MKMRQLGRRGPTVSAVGFGCMPLSGSYGSVNAEEGIATIHRAIDLGVTLLDTADVYGYGRNEELVGRAIRGHRDKVIVATKFGGVFAANSEDESDPRGVPKTSGRDCSPQYVRRACEASLRRLGIDTIDLYQQHRVDPKVPIEETVGALADLVSEGKIRFIGLCEIHPSDLRRAVTVHPVASVQCEYSLFERGVEGEVLGTCDELGIGLIPYSPLSRGLLSGSLTPKTNLEPHDVRLSGHFPRVAPEHLTANAAASEVVDEIARAHDATPAQVALAWLLSRRPSIVPIPGSRRIAHLEENVRAPELELSADDQELLDGIASRVEGARYSERLAVDAAAVSAPFAG
jgi:aryl-alcohol dehydrogenase-like predicted oxidoreductase